MRAFTKFAAALGFGLMGFGLMGFGATAAFADDRDRGDRGGFYDDDDDDDRGRRPQRCETDHDHRGHDATYYDYYPSDRYSTAADNRGGRSDGRYGGDDRYGGGRYGSGRPDICRVDHDHRGHEPRYYDYYPQDRYSRSGGDRRRGYDDGYGYDRGSRVIRRKVYDTRYRARIYLTEEEFYNGGRERRVCTLDVRGPDERYVPYGQLRSIASRECSRRSEIRII